MAIYYVVYICIDTTCDAPRGVLLQKKCERQQGIVIQDTEGSERERELKSKGIVQKNKSKVSLTQLNLSVWIAKSYNRI